LGVEADMFYKTLTATIWPYTAKSERDLPAIDREEMIIFVIRSQTTKTSTHPRGDELQINEESGAPSASGPAGFEEITRSYSPLGARP
jgi:hypothetical protein